MIEVFHEFWNSIPNSAPVTSGCKPSLQRWFWDRKQSPLKSVELHEVALQWMRGAGTTKMTITPNTSDPDKSRIFTTLCEAAHIIMSTQFYQGNKSWDGVLQPSTGA